MFPKQKGPQWELVVPWKRVLHGFVVIMNCMNHPSAKKQTASLLCLDMFGPSVLLCSADCFWWRQSFPRNPLQFFAILCWLRNTQDMLANCSKPYPERSQCTLLQEAVFTPLAGCGAYHQEVSPFLWSCEASEWPQLQGGCISGRLRPTHLVAQVDDSKTMGYVLTGRLLFWSRCIWYEGCRRNIWCILRRGGHS